MNDLAPFLTPHLADLQKVLDGGVTSRMTTRQLDPVLANAQFGPHDKTIWLDEIAKNLKDRPVHLIKEHERRNWLEVVSGGEKRKFLPLLATIDENGNYQAHNKGRETRNMPGLQGSLYEAEFSSADLPKILRLPDEVFYYALRIAYRTNEGNEDFQLHMVLGDRPTRSGKMTAKINVYGKPFVVKRHATQQDLIPAYASPFEPQPVI